MKRFVGRFFNMNNIFRICYLSFILGSLSFNLLSSSLVHLDCTKSETHKNWNSQKKVSNHLLIFAESDVEIEPNKSNPNGLVPAGLYMFILDTGNWVEISTSIELDKINVSTALISHWHAYRVHGSNGYIDRKNLKIYRMQGNYISGDTKYREIGKCSLISDEQLNKKIEDFLNQAKSDNKI
tara:strand:+ start:604 stop:1149 length:546 start_codon:yes stop_codon:yes gene_type:complete